MAIFNPQTNALLSDAMMQFIAGDANGDRNRTYRRKLAGGYNGPKILAEGDSWLCYPQPDELIIPVIRRAPLDLVRQLGQEFAIFTEAVPGDTAWGMRQTVDQPNGLSGLIDYLQPDVLLFSAGGNDLLGAGRLARTLRKGPKPNVKDYFGAAFSRSLDAVMHHYEIVLTTALARKPDLKAVLHAYSHAPVLGPGRGPWLFEPMQALRIPPDQRDAVVREIVDRFHLRQVALADAINAASSVGRRVFVADTREVVAADQWFDEIHPTSQGFAEVARVVRRQILAAHPLIA
jgi:hypothetical protein